MATAPWVLTARARLYPSGRQSAEATAQGTTSQRRWWCRVAPSTARGQTAYQGWKTGASRTVAASAYPA